jgi:HEAT repeat protein
MTRVFRVIAGVVCLAAAVSAQDRLPRRTPEAVDAQIAALSANDATTRATAACRLAWMGRRAVSAVPSLLRVLADTAPVSVVCVVDAQAGVITASATTSPAREAVRALGLLRDVQALPSLLPLLTHADVALRAEAVTAISRFRDPATFDALLTAMDDPAIQVRERAVVAVGNFRDARSVLPLIGKLGDPDPALREHAVVALGAIRDARAVDPLIAALKDPDALVREQAARALSQLPRR